MKRSRSDIDALEALATIATLQAALSLAHERVRSADEINAALNARLVQAIAAHDAIASDLERERLAATRRESQPSPYAAALGSSGLSRPTARSR